MEIKGYKGGGGNTRTPVEDPDSLVSNATVRMLLALSEGEVESIAPEDLPKRVYLDGTPVENEDGTVNIPGVSCEFRNGTPTQDPIPGFPAVESETRINVDLSQSAPWVRQVTNAEIDAVRIRMNFRLVIQESDGDRVGGRIEYKIEYRKIGDSAYTTSFDGAVDGKQKDNYERDHRIDLPKSTTGWQIRVTRTTPDSTSDTRVLDSGIVAITEIVDARVRYPWTSLLFVSFDAKSFQNIPVISIKMKGRRVKVPSNYDPATATYTGSWDGTFKQAYTTNPAWHVYDMATHKRYGLGRRIPANFLNKWTMYAIAQRCDEMVTNADGSQERRYTSNIYIQKRAQAWTLIRDMVSIFNGLVSYGNQQLQISQDAPAAIRHTVTNDEVVEGKFQYTYGSVENRKGIANVSYDDPANHFKTNVTVVQRKDLVERYGIEPLELSAIGCISEYEAQRRGLWALISNTNDRMVSYRVGLDGIKYLIGDVIAVANKYVQGGQFGGRVVSAVGSVVTVDRAIPSNAVVGDKFLAREMGTDGNLIRDIVAISDDRLQLTLSADVQIQPGEVYLLDCAAIAPELFRVTKIVYNEQDNNFTVTGLAYSHSKYLEVDTGARIEERPTTLIPTGQLSAPENIVLEGYSIVNQGTRSANLNGSWNAVDNAVSYEIQIRRTSQTNGSWSQGWSNLPTQSTTSIDVNGVLAGTYQIRVRAVGRDGQSSVWAESDTEFVDGKRGAIPDVAGLIGEGIVNGITWRWVTGTSDLIDMKATELQWRLIANGSPVGDFVELTSQTYPTGMFTQSGLAFAQQVQVRARFVSSFGDFGPWSAPVNGMASDVLGDYYEEIDQAIKDSDTYGELTSDIKDVSDSAANAQNTADAAAGAAADAQADADAAQQTANEGKAAAAVADGKAVAAGNAAAAAQQKANQNAADIVDMAADISAQAQQINQNAQGLAQELIDRAAGDVATAQAAADNLLNAKTEVEAQISQTNTTMQDGFDSLAQQIASISAGTGEQFDSQKIWYYDNGPEGWAQDDAGSIPLTTTDDGWLLPAGSTSTMRSPNPAGVDGVSYKYVRMRMKKVGSPTWNGFIYWIGETETGWQNSRRMAIPAPDFDPATGIGVISVPDIPWTASANIRRIRFDFASGQDASNYFMVDWLAVGRPSPGASQAQIQQLQQAITTGDAAEATQRNQLAVQMRGSYTGTDVGQVTTGLIYSERTARVTADQAITQQITVLEADYNANKSTVSQRLDTLSTATQTNANAITALQSDLSDVESDVSANAQAIGGLQTSVSNIDGRVTANANAITSLSSRLDSVETDTSANSSAIGLLQTKVTDIDGRVTANSQSITTLNSSLNTALYQGSNMWIDGTFESYADGKILNESGTPNSATVKAGVSHVGSKSLEVKRNNGETGNSDKVIGKQIAVRAEGVYRFEAWAMMPSGQTLPATWNTAIGINVVGPEGTQAWYAGITITNALVTAAGFGNWFKVSGKAVIPANSLKSTGRLWISARGVSGGTGYVLYLDDMIVADVTDAHEAQRTANANATAITALTTEVTNVKGDITTISQQITQLNNDITDIEGELSTKADSSALATLTSKVDTIDGKVTAQGNSITQLTASLAEVVADADSMAEQPGNLVPNHSFERKLEGWAVSNGGWGAYAAVGPRTGKYIARYVPTAAASVIRTVKNIPLKKDRTYQFGGWFRRDDLWLPVAGNENNNKICIRRDDTDSVIVETRLTVDNVSTGSTWANISMIYKATADYVVDLAVHQFAAGGNFYADDMYLLDITDQVNISANAAATSALTTRVTNAEGAITSQGSLINQLNNDLSALEDEVATKASSAALQALQSQVSTIDGKVTSQGNAITSLTNTVEANRGMGDNLVQNANFTQGATAFGTQGGSQVTFGAYGDGKEGVRLLRSSATSPAVFANLKKPTPITGRRRFRFVVKARGVSGNMNMLLRRINYNGTVDGTYEDKNITLTADWTVTTWETNLTPTTGTNGTAFGIYCHPANGEIWIDTFQVFDVTDELAITANATAIQNLTTEVTQQGNEIDAAVEATTSLSASLNNDAKATATTAGNMLVNTGFERGQDLWDGWNANTDVYTASEPRTGTKILRGKVGSITAIGQRIVGVKQGRTYRFGGYVKRNADMTIGSVGNNKFRLGNATTGTGPISELNFSQSNVGTPWTLLSKDWVATSDMDVAFSINYLLTAGEIYFDDVFFVDVTDEVNNTANANAISTLSTRVTATEGSITSQGQQITQLNNDLSTLDDAVGDLTTLVNTKASAAALQALQTQVTAIDGRVTSQGSAITQLNNEVDTLDGALGDLTAVVNTKASAAALQALQTQVTTLDGKVTSQGSSITQLTNNLAMTTADTDSMSEMPGNLVMNHSFERQFETWEFTNTGWDAYAAQGPRTGKYIARCAATTTPTVLRTKTAFPLVKGRTYRYGVWVRRDTTWTSGDANNTKVAIRSESGDVLRAYTLFTVENVTTGATWANIGGTYKSVADELVDFAIHMRGQGGNFYADDAYIVDITDEVNIDANASATSALTTRVTSAEGKITSQGSAITQLDNELDALAGVVDTKASASALQSLTNTVTQQGNTLDATTKATQKLSAMLQSSNAIMNGDLANNADQWQDSGTGSSFTYNASEKAIQSGTDSIRVANITSIPVEPGLKLRVTLEARATAAGFTPSSDSLGFISELSNATGWIATTAGWMQGLTTAFVAKTYDLTIPTNYTGRFVYFRMASAGAAPSGVKVLVRNIVVTTSTGVAQKAEASALTQLTATVTNIDGKVTANTQALTAMNTRVGDAESAIDGLNETVASNGLAMATGFNQMRAMIGDNSAAITQQNTVIADLESSTAEQINTINASVGDMSATVQQAASAVADIDGKLSAQWGVKVQTNAGGDTPRVAGVQLGIDATGSSSFLVQADTFGVYTGGTGSKNPFVVKNGTAYMQAAMIEDLSVSFAKIADNIRSTSYVAGSAGWNLPKNGNAELNNVTVRGHVEAASGSFTGTVIATDGRFNGTVYANRIEGDVGAFAIDVQQNRDRSVAKAQWVWFDLLRIRRQSFDQVVNLLGGLLQGDRMNMSGAGDLRAGMSYSPGSDGGLDPGFLSYAILLRGYGATSGGGAMTVGLSLDGQLLNQWDSQANIANYGFTVPAGTGDAVLRYGCYLDRNGSMRLAILSRFSAFVARNSNAIGRAESA